MGENLEIEGRLSVRSPMQWSDEPHGGFSRSPFPKRCAGRSWTTIATAPRAINVSRQRREEGSLLNWFERLIRRRRECPEIGFGTLELLDVGAAVGAGPPLRLGGVDGRARCTNSAGTAVA